MDRQNESTETGPRRKAEKTLIGVGGFLAGVVGVVFAVAPLTMTLPIRLTGAIASAAAAGLMIQAARDRDRGMLSNGMLALLLSTGSLVSVLVVLLSHQASLPAEPPSTSTPSPSPVATDGGSSSPATGRPVPPDTDASSTPPGDSPSAPGKVWLADLTPVANGSEDVWTTKAVQVKGTTYERALSTNLLCRHREIHFALGRQYSSFEARVGIADDSPATEPLTFYILADGKRTKTIANVQLAAPKNVNIPVDGVSRLALGVQTPDEYCLRKYETAVWMDPKLSP